ncbi:MAG: DUF488 family protein [Candidatus Dadabacteria bacterium]|nr:DUF488 family protein [Candidatus Dadabacteria bacterium]
MTIKLKRVYDKPEAGDGVRILVERLWPRGLSKNEAKVDIWLKDIAPSAGLRKWFSHDPSKWEEFRKRYHSELDQNRDAIKEFLEITEGRDATFVYASREKEFNSAKALKSYIEKLVKT